MSQRTRITRGQYVAAEKLELARRFRKSPTSDEEALWQALRHDGLAGLHFRRQQVIDGFIADFYCATARLAVELDGPVHGGQSEEDARRDRIFASRGIRTLRIARKGCGWNYRWYWTKFLRLPARLRNPLTLSPLSGSPLLKGEGLGVRSNSPAVHSPHGAQRPAPGGPLEGVAVAVGVGVFVRAGDPIGDGITNGVAVAVGVAVGVG